ncbi:DUF2339 domain-containing protein [Defluviimonas sp. WL0002]|uniref:DUF2339 domain-containing protein n=1 Tax=Albidovulum marisflavi TaxID=2984159 RepID=A0ABT2Z9W4_9RHOB|nr:DUF2339 domain-containing protein [Defluviimonas sp. WL0002]MCV2867935.1 DUF2339 domain-containing protein [Defluviimonas sp. WL0002]
MDFEIMLGLVAFGLLIALPVALIVLFVSVSGLRRRMATLEGRLLDLRRDLGRLNAQAAPARPDEEPERPEPEATQPEFVTAEPETQQPPTAPPLDEPAKTPATISGPWSDLPPPGDATPVLPPAHPPVPDRVSPLGEWIVSNWVYVVSALSLALAGVFLVQYGVENGLLPPPARVIGAILFGLALIAGGEWVRRRWGDEVSVVTAHVPSTLSGAGLVSIFSAVLAARQLYDLIGSETAFAGLLLTAALAVVLGWFHGPFLAAVGLIGASAAPFLVGGDGEAPYWLYGYYAIVAAVGLTVDTIRRWAWVSVLAVALGYGGTWLVLMGTGGAGWAALTLVALAGFAVCIPARGFMPDHQGTTLAEAVLARAAKPHFPTLLAGGAVALSTVWLSGMATATAAESVLVLLCLTVLALALVVWAEGAPALSDLAAIPAAGFLLRLGFEGLNRWPLATEYAAKAIAYREPESAAPMTAALLLGLGTAITLAAARQSGRASRWRAGWAAGAALVAPLTALVLELFWAPSRVLGSYPWALHVIALGALMAGMAMQFARADGEDRRRAAYAVLSTLSLIALALFLILTKGALSLALGVLIVVAAALDRRFRLPEMGWFIQAAALVLTWRLVIDPGLEWAVDRGPLWEVVASYAGAVAAAGAALHLLRDLERKTAKVFLESAFAGYAALFANVMILRWLLERGGDDFISHWGLTLNAMPWLITMLAQLHRVQLGGAMRWLRWTIAVVAGLLAAGGLALATLLANPLFGFMGGRSGDVLGPPILDTLFVAYAVPGLLILLALTRLRHLHKLLRILLGAGGVALLSLYAGLEIRRLWQGPDISVSGVLQGELYSYTIALMVVGAGLLYQSLARGSVGLRRGAMTVIALTIAKVFLIDISGLTGLTRVFSLLALGLALIGLGLLNRWVAKAQGGGRS